VPLVAGTAVFCGGAAAAAEAKTPTAPTVSAPATAALQRLLGSPGISTPLFVELHR